MPKSSASSPFARSRRAATHAIAVAAVGFLAAGCSDVKDLNYGAPAVQSAFGAVGVALYTPQESIPDDPLTPPLRSAHGPARPLTSLLNGVRNAVMTPNVSPDARATVLRGRWMLVFVYPRPEQAQAKARSFADIEGAEAILHTTDFGYAINGNVVVDYRVYGTSDRIPGYLGEWQSVRALDHRIRQQVLAALRRLG